jgi:hypothetical protein
LHWSWQVSATTPLTYHFLQSVGHFIHLFSLATRYEPSAHVSQLSGLDLLLCSSGFRVYKGVDQRSFPVMGFSLRVWRQREGMIRCPNLMYLRVSYHSAQNPSPATPADPLLVQIAAGQRHMSGLFPATGVFGGGSALHTHCMSGAQRQRNIPFGERSHWSQCRRCTEWLNSNCD